MKLNLRRAILCILFAITATGFSMKPSNLQAAPTNAVHVTSIAALEMITYSSFPSNGVWVDSYYGDGQSPPVFYDKATSGTCPLADLGSQIPLASSSGCAYAEFGPVLDWRSWGAVGGATATDPHNNATSISNAIKYACSVTTSSFQVPTLSGAGLAYGIQAPIEIPSGCNGLIFGWAYVQAIGGSWVEGTWPPNANPWTSVAWSGTPPVGMIDSSGATPPQGIQLDSLILDGNTQANIAGISFSKGGTQLVIANTKILNFESYGVFDNGGNVTVEGRTNITQSPSGDIAPITSPTVSPGRTGYGLYFANSKDSMVLGAVSNYSFVPLFVDVNSADIAVKSSHLYNGATTAQGGTATIFTFSGNTTSGSCILTGVSSSYWSNTAPGEPISGTNIPLNSYILTDNNSSTIQFANVFGGCATGTATGVMVTDGGWTPLNVVANGEVALVGNTIDNGTVLSNVKTGGDVVNLILQGNNFEYSSGESWAMPAWVEEVTQYATTSNSITFTQNGKVQINGNNFPQGTVGGSGAAIQNLSLVGVGSSGTWSPTGLLAAAAINNPPTPGGDQQTTLTSGSCPYTLQPSDTQTMFYVNTGSVACVIYVPGSLPWTWNAKFYVPGTTSGAVTLTPTTTLPATINGATTSMTLSQNMLYGAEVSSNVGGSAANLGVK